MVKSIEQTKNLVGLLAQVLGDVGDILADGKIDWADTLKMKDLLYAIKDGSEIDFAMTGEELIDLTDAEKEELVAYFNEKFKTDYKASEEVVKQIFALLFDLYIIIKWAIDLFAKISKKP